MQGDRQRLCSRRFREDLLCGYEHIFRAARRGQSRGRHVQGGACGRRRLSRAGRIRAEGGSVVHHRRSASQRLCQGGYGSAGHGLCHRGAEPALGLQVRHGEREACQRDLRERAWALRRVAQICRREHGQLRRFGRLGRALDGRCELSGLSAVFQGRPDAQGVCVRERRTQDPGVHDARRAVGRSEEPRGGQRSTVLQGARLRVRLRRKRRADGREREAEPEFAFTAWQHDEHRGGVPRQVLSLPADEYASGKPPARFGHAARDVVPGEHPGRRHRRFHGAPWFSPMRGRRHRGDCARQPGIRTERHERGRRGVEL